jgi:hypothetical protein
MKKHLLLSVLAIVLFTLAQAQTGTIQLPATGQTTSYYPGDDGDLQIGVPIPVNRFTDHGDGSVTDELTGLMWTTDANLIASRDPDFDQDRVVGDGDINWLTALNYIQKLNDENYLGHNDWRMPNAMELRSLLNLGNDSITFPDNHPFVNLKEGYWSSTTNDRLKGSAIIVYLSRYVVHANLSYPAGHFMGLGKYLGPVINYYVAYLLPVRDGGASGEVEVPQSGQTVSYYAGDDVAIGAGTPWPSPRLVDNKDGSVTDRLTGLMWTKDMLLMFNRDPGYYEEHGSSWTTALDYIAKLNNESYLGYNDWRLPNYNELVSLIDYSRHGPGLPKFHPFTATWPYEIYPLLGYWSSTSVAADSGKAWYYHFGVSNLYSNEKTINNFVWPVRTDNNSLPSGAIHGFIDGEDIPLKGFEITLEGPVNARTETDVDGYYEFANITDGNYTVTPSREYFIFTPTSKTAAVNGTAESCDFTVAYTRAYGWTDISSHLFQFDGVAGSGLHDLYFISDDEGWITSTNGGIYHTTDGGETFEKQTLTLGGYATAIFMFNENEGYAGSVSGVIYHTTNGGDEWTLVGFTGGRIQGISFPPGSTTGYSIGTGGLFWEISPEGLEQIEFNTQLDHYCISTPSVGNTFIGGSPHRQWYYDGNEITPSCMVTGGVGGIYYYNDTLGWIVQPFGGIVGLFGTSDYNCWWLQKLDDTTQYHFYDVHSPNGKDVWIVGAPGMIYYSPNGDDYYYNPDIPKNYNYTIWNQQAKGLTKEWLAAVFFTSPTNGYTSGNNGTLLKYTKLPGAPEGADILGIQLPEQVGEAVVNKQERTVTAEVLNTIDITKLVPQIFPSAGASVDPPSGSRQDFTNPVVYKITASDGTSKNWTVSVSQAVGIDENRMFSKKFDFWIFPNPAGNEFRVQSPEIRENGAILELFGLDGRKILQKSIPKGKDELTVNVSSLQNGLYFCRITPKAFGENKSVTKQLIIQK